MSINAETIQTLSDKLSHKLFLKVASKPFLVGSEIISFCHYPQVNKFLLFQIYIDWKNQAAKLKHPYFDYQAPEVIEAMEQFLNVLSNHIRVEQRDFKQLLDKAVYNTFRLLAEPKDSLVSFFYGAKASVAPSLITQYLPYFEDFDFALQGILLYAENHRLETLSRDVFETLLDRTFVQYERFSQQSIQQYISQKLKTLSGDLTLEAEKEVLKSTQTMKVEIKDQPVISQPLQQPEKEKTTVHVPTVSPAVTPKEIKIQKLPLNKQFQYAQKIFRGDLEALKQITSLLGQTHDLETAKNLIQVNVVEKYQVDPEDSLFQEFASTALYHVL